MNKKTIMMLGGLFLIMVTVGACSAIKGKLTDKQKWDYHRSNWNQLLIAAYDGNSEKIKTLIKEGEQVNNRSNDGYTALEVAVRAKKIRSVEALLNCNAGVNLKDDEGMTPLITACLFDDTEIVVALLKYKANVNESNNAGWTAIMSAATSGSREVLKLLIKYNADVNCKRPSDGYTPLMFAVSKGDYEKVKILIDAGANKSSCSTDGKTISEINKDNNFDNKKLYADIETLLN